ncbi:MAG: thioredoxin family protein, partial [Odoribacteraceae bacterium]|nr:thioredoxin family protein [Odoribacteraceae bacterium]
MRTNFSLFVALLAFPLVAAGQGVTFETGSLAQALKKARGARPPAPRVVFVDCYTTWCGPCKIVDQQIFPLAEVGDYFRQHLVSIRIDMEAGEGPAIKQRYRVRGYPTFLFLDPDGNEINRFMGVRDAASFMEAVKLSVDPATSPAATLARYNEQKSLPRAIAYLQALRRSVDENYHAEVARLYDDLPPHERFSNAFWEFLSYTLTAANETTLVDRLLRDKPAADRFLSRERVDDALYNALFALARKYLGQSLAGITPREALDRLAYLPLVAAGKQDAPILLEVIDRFRDARLDEIPALFDVARVAALDAPARYRLEGILPAIKGIPPDAYRDYLAAKIEHHDRLNARLRRQLD